MIEQKNYVDSFGRWHNKPVTDSDPLPSNNAFIYTGFAKALGFTIDDLRVFMCFMECVTDYGFNRHPYKANPPISRDEVVGVYMSGTVDPYHHELWKRNGFQICNVHGFKPKRIWKLNPFKVFKNYFDLANAGNFWPWNPGSDTTRKITWMYDYIHPIAFKLPASDVYFISRKMNESISLALHLKFFFSAMITMLFSNGSSKALMCFKFVSMNDDRPFLEGVALRIIDTFVDAEKALSHDFKPDHPFALHLRRLYLIRNKS